MGRIVAIVQARMGSSRLPGKVLKPLGGVPLIWHTFQRLKRVNGIDQIVLATSDRTKDDVLIEFANKEEIQSFRGSENDVLGRYYLAAKAYSADVVVRITGDCPFIDPIVTGMAIGMYCEENADYLSNTIERTYPKGTDTEVFSFSSLERAYKKAQDKSDREHVTKYMYENPMIFAIKGFKNDRDLSYIRHCIDYERDYLFEKALFHHLAGENIFFTTGDVERLILERPWLLEINRNVEKDQ